MSQALFFLLLKESAALITDADLHLAHLRQERTTATTSEWLSFCVDGLFFFGILLHVLVGWCGSLFRACECRSSLAAGLACDSGALCSFVPICLAAFVAWLFVYVQDTE